MFSCIFLSPFYLSRGNCLQNKLSALFGILNLATGVLSQFDDGRTGSNFNKFDCFFKKQNKKNKQKKISTIWLLFRYTHMKWVGVGGMVSTTNNENGYELFNRFGVFGKKIRSQRSVVFYDWRFDMGLYQREGSFGLIGAPVES